MARFEEAVFVAIRRDVGTGEEFLDPSTVSYTAEGARVKVRSASAETNARQPMQRIAAAMLVSNHSG